MFKAVDRFVRSIDHCAQGRDSAVAELEIFLPAFLSEKALRRWISQDTPFGTPPAHAIFVTVLDGPFNALVLDPAGPKRIVLDRSLIEAALETYAIASDLTDRRGIP